MIVKTRSYTYSALTEDLKRLKNKYKHFEYFSIGKSEEGRNIFCIRLGRGKTEVMYNGAHHGLEWITSLLLMKFVEQYMQKLSNGGKIQEIDVKKVYDNATIYIIPMVNPDGINIAVNGCNPLDARHIRIRQICEDVGTLWQSNINGVDLNHNYDAGFSKQKMLEREHKIFGPHHTRYGGKHPFSESETRAVRDFTRKHNFKIVLAYHSQGEVIYYKYMNTLPKNSVKYGMEMEKLSGYELDETEGFASYGGFKDWYIKTFNKPAYTIEVGLGKNPLPIEQINGIMNKNFGILISAPLL